jgi:hypothetical protein
MSKTSATPSKPVSADEALSLLSEAWAYYTPRPKLVTEQNSRPSPIFDEYYAA